MPVHSCLTKVKYWENFKQNQLDFAELSRIYGQEEALEIIKLFLGVTGTFTECIDLALTSKDIDAVNHFAYSIKGPFSSLQLTALSDLASKLPKLAAKHKWKDAKKVYGQLLELYKPIKSQMEEEIQKSTSTRTEFSNFATRRRVSKAPESSLS